MKLPRWTKAALLSGTQPLRRKLSATAKRNLEFLMESQAWPLERLQAYQWDRLKSLLEHCYAHVPFYRNRFRDLGVQPAEIRSPRDFRELPILEKEHIQQFKADLISDTHPAESLIPNATGGSTGKPLNFYQDREYADWADAARARAWKCWLGFPDRELVAVLWGDANDVGARQTWGRRLKEAIRDRVLWINTFDLDEEKLRRYLEYYNMMRPRLVRGYATSLAHVARYTRERGIELSPAQAIISSTEVLYPHIRAQIEDAFGGKVFDSYGCREVSHVGIECERQDGLHLTMETQYVELEGNDILVTNLVNRAMPLVRYRVGDLARSLVTEACGCGRESIRMMGLMGRDNDNIELPNGKIINGEYFEFLFFGFNSVRQFQVIYRKRSARLCVNLAISGPEENVEQMIRKRIKEAFGFSEVDVDTSGEFLRSPSGKLRFVYSIDE